MAQKRVDLNLLNVFSAVMIEQSVTRAADRLSMTQPAVSNALGRLRLMFKDDLFVRGSGGIRPTARAKALWQSMRHPLDELRSIAIPSEFTPATTATTFNIAVTDTLQARVAPLLTKRLMAEAPTARLVFHHHSNPSSVAGLETGELDCAVGMFPTYSSDIIVEGIAVDEYVAVFRSDHPKFGHNITLEDFLAAKHVLVKQSLRQLGIVDAWLKLQELEREIAVLISSSADAIELVCENDLVAVIPLSYMQNIGSNKAVRWSPLPFAHDQIFYKLAWHERTDREYAGTWLRKLVRDCVVEAVGEGHPTQQQGAG